MSSTSTTPAKLSTPSITGAQILAVVQFVVGFAVARLWITNTTAQMVLQVASVVLPVVTVLADAIIRHGRVAALVAQIDHEAAAAERLYYDAVHARNAAETLQVAAPSTPAPPAA